MKSTFPIIIAVGLSLLIGSFLFNKDGNKSAVAETAFERVMRTQTIRCGYQPYAPALIKDPNTGKMSGIFYDITEEIGRRLNLKIEWTEEVGYGVIAEGFNTNRYDLFCNTVWPTAERSKVASFSIPLYYSPVGLIVKKGDHRFDNDFSKLNDPNIIFAVKDGDVSDSFKNDQFPLAKKHSIPQLSDTTQLIDDIVHGKADVVINEPSLLIEYNKSNPDQAINIAEKNPVRVAFNTFMMPKNEYQLKMMLDTTLTELLNNGFVEKTIKKYDTNNLFLPISKPYESK